MAEKILVEIEVDDKGATKSVDNIEKSIDGVSKSAKKAQKETKGLGKAFKGVGAAVKGVGAALKAAGIGLIIGLVSKFTEVLLQNQAVMDTLNKAFNTISIVFQQLTKPLFEVGAAISANSEAFDALVRVGKNLLTIVIAPLKLGFLEIKAVLLAAQLAWEQSFLGDGDEKTIKELEDGLRGIRMELIELGVAVLDAGKAIGDDFVEAMTELGDIGGKVTDALVKGLEAVDFAAAKAGANAINLAKKRSVLLELEQTRLRERFDLEAELQRQIRDDVSKTIEVRIAANDRLGEVLSEQVKAEQASVKERIANLQLEQRLLSNTFERQAEIFALQTELIAIQATEAGFRAEQLTNENSLLREQKDILQSRRDTELEVAEITKTASAELLLSETERIRAQIAIEAELHDARLLALDERLVAETEGTLEYQAILNERAILDANYDANKLKQSKALSKSEIDLDRAVNAAKLSLASGALGAIQGFLEEGSAAAKAVAVGQATIDTIRGGIAAYTSTAAIPGVGPLLAPLAAGVAVASGLAGIKKILAVKTPGGGGGGSAPSVSSGPSAPSVGQAISLVNPNNGADNIGDQIQQGFNGSNMRAFVVGSDVSGQQQLDREIAQNGTFG